MAEKTADALWAWSGEGELPIVIDASSCAHGLAAELPGRHEGLEVLDSIAWVHDHLLPNLQIDRRLGSVAVHPTCSARHLGLTRQLEGIAAAMADEVTTPAEATCCGFAGDRGFLFPELTASATAPEAAELATAATAQNGHAAHISSNRTCELALERATGAPYTSFILPLEELTRP
jgi:D-lactate dehydrogenase